MPTMEADRRTELLNAAAVNTWQNQLWTKVNNHWTDTTGDIKWLLTCDCLTERLYQWGVETGRVEKLPQHPFHRTASVIATAFHADRQAFIDEANRYIRARMVARQAELDQIIEDARLAEELREAQLAALEITV